MELRTRFVTAGADDYSGISKKQRGKSENGKAEREKLDIEQDG